MNYELDFEKVCARLLEAREGRKHEFPVEEVNPYLLQEVLPLLKGDCVPKLRDIDYEQFAEYDPPQLVGYLQEMDSYEYRTQKLGKRFCDLPPASAKTRIFL